MAQSEVPKYAIIKPLRTISNGVWSVYSVVEKPAAADALSSLASLGRYVLSPSTFEVLSTTGHGVSGEIQLADGVNKMAQAGQVAARRFDGTHYDCGDKLRYVMAVIHKALQNEIMGTDIADFLKGLGFLRQP